MSSVEFVEVKVNKEQQLEDESEAMDFQDSPLFELGILRRTDDTDEAATAQQPTHSQGNPLFDLRILEQKEITAGYFAAS